MNWRGGMFRIWIVASLIWISFVSFLAYKAIAVPRHIAAQEQRCFDERQADPSLGNPFDCFKHGEFMFADVLPIERGRILPFIGIAAGPVCAAFALWFVVEWIAAGFRRPPRRAKGPTAEGTGGGPD
jgi:hypothetical protein